MKRFVPRRRPACRWLPLPVVADWLALVAGDAGAACLVLKGGTVMTVRTAPQVKGAMVVFQDPNGRLSSMRASEVNVPATERANATGSCSAGAVTSYAGTPIRDTHAAVVMPAPETAAHYATAAEMQASANRVSPQPKPAKPPAKPAPKSRKTKPKPPNAAAAKKPPA